MSRCSNSTARSPTASARLVCGTATRKAEVNHAGGQADGGLRAWRETVEKGRGKRRAEGWHVRVAYDRRRQGGDMRLTQGHTLDAQGHTLDAQKRGKGGLSVDGRKG
eukprot:366260-Chlamydomonas_euryale.AAC.38